MNRLLPALAIASALAQTACAGEPTWKFRPGQTFSWECRSEFHFAQFQLLRPSSPADPPPGEMVRNAPPPPPLTQEELDRLWAEQDARIARDWTEQEKLQLDRIRRRELRDAIATENDPVRRAALEALLKKEGYITTREIRALHVDPQWETVTLQALVTAIGDDGAARIAFTVQAVRIETRFDDSGAHAIWDSAKSPTTELAGFKRYEAVLGHRFEAVIGADGEIRELAGADWPAAAPARTAKVDEREALAANVTHAPTPARAWLDMIFTLTPSGEDAWERSVEIPDAEILSLRADSPEQVAGYNCVRAKAKSRDRKHIVAVPRGSDVGDIALRMCRETAKTGHSWFSPKSGCMVKAELKASTESGGTSIIFGDFEMTIELKDRGFTELHPSPSTGTR